ncbi:MAG TPA: class II aldolase/adducin family protein, partial [Candidatus Cloacimonadota bacterium]|nr:class II aldolase/adducin family protein [Candidatus Cloacimonadota bacterium]
MKISDLKDYDSLMAEIAETARLIHSYGWAEANAGNISIDVSDRVQNPQPDTRYYLVSRTGSRYRQTANDPMKNLLLIASGASDVCFPPDARPTMEWISHRCLQKAIGDRKVVLHTHPAEIIALAQLSYDEEEFNELFANLLPELPLYLPEGFAIAAHRMPGSQALCDASLEALDGQKALIWSGHGLLCFG